MAGINVPLGPAVVNLSGVRAGDQNQIEVSITADGAPYPLTGLTVTAQARRKSTDVDPAMTAEIVMVNAAGGRFTLRWPGDEVTAVLDGKESWSGVWDLQAQAGAGEDAVTVAAGTLGAVMDVTR